MLVKDRPAFEWRKEHKAEVEQQIQGFMDKAYRRSQSRKSAENKYCGVAVFCGWQRKLPKEILGEIIAGKSNPYRLLDDYVTYLVKDAKAAPHTTKNYLSAVTKWLKFEAVEISNEKLKDIVELPRQYAITSDRIPTTEELRDVVVVSKLRGKALITTLASSGMRIGEVLSLRVKDIDLEKRPSRITLRPEVTKDRQGRMCFISDEATAFLKEYLNSRVQQKDSYVFLGRHQGANDDGRGYQQRRRDKQEATENKPISYWNADFILSTALRNADLTEKDDHGRDRIHIHSLRKFFFTRMLSVLGREVTEALMGHKEYLDAAYRRYTVDELGEQYVKGMEAVTVMSSRGMNREEVDKQIELANYKFYLANSKLGESPEEVLAEGEKKKGRTLTLDEELSLFQGEYAVVKEQETALLEEGEKRFSEGTIPEQKRVHEEEIDKFTQDGWTFVAVLPSGKVLIQKA